jgi:hypothetical protein
LAIEQVNLAAARAALSAGGGSLNEILHFFARLARPAWPPLTCAIFALHKTTLSIPLQDAEGDSLVMALISANRISAALTLTRTSPTNYSFVKFSFRQNNFLTRGCDPS